MERSARSSVLIIGSCVIGIILVLVIGVWQMNVAASERQVCDITKNAFCIAPRAEVLTDPLEAATIPRIATPAWMSPPAQVRTVSYSVETRGTIVADLEEFTTVSGQTLNDSRGWSRLGVRFERVDTGGDFTLVLAEASQMSSFSSGCDATYSCRAGRYVIINQDRWLQGAPSWMNAGGSLNEYRQMVVNHETGHWLGHGHTFCTTQGQPATVMQQQSIDMQGCTPNAWPLQGELYAPNLGIRS